MGMKAPYPPKGPYEQKTAAKACSHLVAALVALPKMVELRP